MITAKKKGKKWFQLECDQIEMKLIAYKNNIDTCENNMCI